MAAAPASRFGPLLIAAGMVNFVSTLVWATSAIPYTIGQVVDLVPPVVFLHVFLAFPDGRLRGGFVRALVVASYGTAIGLELVRMYFGDFGPHNLLAGHLNPGVAEVVREIQLTSVSVFCLTGVAVLAARRWRAGRPLRRSLGLLVDAFGLALAVIAFLFLSAAYGGPWVAQIRWAAMVTLAIAPAVFLAGLLQARLARSALGDLVVELRGDLEPADLRDALARALRDPSLDLAYWLPEFDTYADSTVALSTSTISAVDARRRRSTGTAITSQGLLSQRRRSRTDVLAHPIRLQPASKLVARGLAVVSRNDTVRERGLASPAETTGNYNCAVHLAVAMRVLAPDRLSSTARVARTRTTRKESQCP